MQRASVRCEGPADMVVSAGSVLHFPLRNPSRRSPQDLISCCPNRTDCPQTFFRTGYPITWLPQVMVHSWDSDPSCEPQEGPSCPPQPPGLWRPQWGRAGLVLFPRHHTVDSPNRPPPSEIPRPETGPSLLRSPLNLGAWAGGGDQASRDHECVCCSPPPTKSLTRNPISLRAALFPSSPCVRLAELGFCHFWLKEF